MKAPFDSECQCGNPMISKGITPVRMRGKQVAQCPECDPTVIEEDKREGDPNKVRHLAVKVLSHLSSNEDGSFCRHKVSVESVEDEHGALPDGATKRGGFLLIGPTGSWSLGEVILVSGHFVNDPKWGFQLKALLQAQLAVRESEAGLHAFLMRHLPHVGEVRADLLIRAMGGRSGVLEALEGDYLKLATVPGITEERALEIKTAYDATAGYREFRLFASNVGLGEKVVAASIERWGGEAEATIKSNPFDLMDLEGVGFVKADEVRTHLGQSVKSTHRRAAALKVCLESSLAEGHCFVPTSLLDPKGSGQVAIEMRKLGLDEEDVVVGLEHLKTTPRVSKSKSRHKRDDSEYEMGRCAVIQEEDRIYLESIHTAEWNIADNIARLLSSHGNMPEVTYDSTLARDELWRGRTPAPEQEAAVVAACESPVSILVGPAGTGKTATCNSIIGLFEKQGLKVKLLAPTGKAAVRMTELTGHEAATIHRAVARLAATEDGQFDEALIILDECFESNQRILTEEGWLTIGPIVKAKRNVRVWSHNPETHALELKPIARWIQNPAPREMLKINATRSASQRDGRSIVCTSSHKVYTPNGKVRAGDLRVGDLVFARGAMMTPVQRSITIGSIFGDGSLSKVGARTSPQFSLTCGEADYGYLKMKKDILGSLAGKETARPSEYQPANLVYRLMVNITDDHYILQEEMLPDGYLPSGRRRWKPSTKLLDMVDDHALAIWFMDNGSSQKIVKVDGSINWYASLHTERFSEATQEQLISFFEEHWSLSPVIQKTKLGMYLRFSGDDSRRLYEIISPFIPECMQRKTPLRAEYVPRVEDCIPFDICHAKIRSIEVQRKTSKRKLSHFVYDLEVEDNHNYIAGNILVSNCSMISAELLARVLPAIRSGARLVLMGDSNQLPSIDAGRVLYDLMEARCVGGVPLISSTRLTRIFRGAGEGDTKRIPEFASAINDGYVLDLTMKGTDVVWAEIHDPEEMATFIAMAVSEKIPAKYDIEPRDIQVIAAQRGDQSKKGFEIGVRHLNVMLQEKLNPSLNKQELHAGDGYVIRAGDKVIHKKNNYDLLTFNGEIGFVTRLEWKGFIPKPNVVTSRRTKAERGESRRGEDTVHCTIDYGDRVVGYTKDEVRQVQLAYALTTHSCQGSSAKAVIGVVHDSHSFMLTKQLLYVMFSRAEEYMLGVGQSTRLVKALRNERGVERRTTLQQKLYQAIEHWAAT